VPVIAGVDVGNATTEVAVVADGRLLGTDRLPTRGRKGSPESLRGAATLVRRLERRLGGQVDEARVAPLRAVDTTTMTVPQLPPPTGRLRVLAAGVATPGGRGACVGTPLRLDGPVPLPRPRARSSPQSRRGLATPERRSGSADSSRRGYRSRRCSWRGTKGCSSPTASIPRSR
jgi:hypothetical protein